jgi:hypothetical protein
LGAAGLATSARWPLKKTMRLAAGTLTVVEIGTCDVGEPVRLISSACADVAN